MRRVSHLTVLIQHSKVHTKLKYDFSSHAAMVKIDVKIDEIIYSKRKTIGLEVKPDGRLVVHAPFKTSKRKILEVVLRHRRWIENARKKMKKREEALKKESKKKGCKEAYFLGKKYRVRIVLGQKEHILMSSSEFLLSAEYAGHEKELLKSWYKIWGYFVISERVKMYAEKNGFKYAKITITEAVRRWGSCSTKGNLCFSWRLVMCPMEVIDYVVVHELVHLKVKNHSKQFWAEVEKIYPQYKKHREWLRKNEYKLHL